MSEGFLPKLINQWRKRDNNSGLKETSGIVLGNAPSNQAILFGFIPNMDKHTLGDFATLPLGIQSDIIRDVGLLVENDEDKNEILIRAINLIEQGKNLDKMNEPSDLKYKPKDSLQDLERKEAEKFATEGTDYGSEYQEK